MFSIKDLFKTNSTKNISRNDYNLNYDFESINCTLNFYENIFIFTGGKFPAPENCASFFEKHGAPDFVIACDAGLETLDLFNKAYRNIDFSPDIILGDMDSLSKSALIKKYTGNKKKKAELIKFKQDKDFSDTELALILAQKLSKKYFTHNFNLSEDGKKSVYSEEQKSKLESDGLKPSSVVLIGASGGRIDHFMAVFDLFSSEVHPDFWLTEEQLLAFVPQKVTAIVKTQSKNSPVSVLRTTEKNSGGKISSSGLEWESSVFRKKGVFSLSNEISKTFFDKGLGAKIKAENGDFILCAGLDALIDLKRL